MGTLTSTVQSLIRRAAAAYTTGPAAEDARAVCNRVAREHLATTVCYWNGSFEAPNLVAQSYIGLLQLIPDLPTDCYLSMKASALDFNLELLRKIIKEARNRNTTVHFDAMGPDTVDTTFNLIREVRCIYPNLSCTLPGRWIRSIRDVDFAINLGLRIRVVKGEWCGLNGDETDKSEGFMNVIDRLAAGHARHVAVATHDAALATRCFDRLERAGVSCELELLYGLPRRAMLKFARDRQIAVRIYVPYGQAGLPYRLKDVVHNPRIFMWFARDLVRASRRSLGDLSHRSLPDR
jgi:proline dehydrogenase